MTARTCQAAVQADPVGSRNPKLTIGRKRGCRRCGVCPDIVLWRFFAAYVCAWMAEASSSGP